MEWLIEGLRDQGAIAVVDGRVLVLQQLTVTQRDDLSTIGVRTMPDLETLALYSDRTTARRKAQERGFVVNDVRVYEGDDIAWAVEHASELWGWPVCVARRRADMTQDAWLLYERSDVDLLPTPIREGHHVVLVGGVMHRDVDIKVSVAVDASEIVLIASGYRHVVDDDRVVRVGLGPSIVQSALEQVIHRLWSDGTSSGLYWASLGWQIGEVPDVIVDDWGVGLHPKLPWSRDFDVNAWFSRRGTVL